MGIQAGRLTRQVMTSVFKPEIPQIGSDNDYEIRLIKALLIKLVTTERATRLRVVFLSDKRPLPIFIIFKRRPGKEIPTPPSMMGKKIFCVLRKMATMAEQGTKWSVIVSRKTIQFIPEAPRQVNFRYYALDEQIILPGQEIIVRVQK